MLGLAWQVGHCCDTWGHEWDATSHVPESVCIKWGCYHSWSPYSFLKRLCWLWERWKCDEKKCPSWSQFRGVVLKCFIVYRYRPTLWGPDMGPFPLAHPIDWQCVMSCIASSFFGSCSTQALWCHTIKRRIMGMSVHCDVMQAREQFRWKIKSTVLVWRHTTYGLLKQAKQKPYRFYHTTVCATLYSVRKYFRIETGRWQWCVDHGGYCSLCAGASRGIAPDYIDTERSNGGFTYDTLSVSGLIAQRIGSDASYIVCYQAFWVQGIAWCFVWRFFLYHGMTITAQKKHFIHYDSWAGKVLASYKIVSIGCLLACQYRSTSGHDVTLLPIKQYTFLESGPLTHSPVLSYSYSHHIPYDPWWVIWSFIIKLWHQGHRSLCYRDRFSLCVWCIHGVSIASRSIFLNMHGV